MSRLIQSHNPMSSIIDGDFKSNQIKYSNFYSLQYNVLKLLFKVNKRGHYIAFLKRIKVECSPNLKMELKSGKWLVEAIAH